MDYQIIWSPQGIETLGEVIAFIAEENPAAALSTGDLILKRIERLGQFPRLGKIFARLAREDVREILVRPYRVIYHVQDDRGSVTILTVWHGARLDPDLKP